MYVILCIFKSIYIFLNIMYDYYVKQNNSKSITIFQQHFRCVYFCVLALTSGALKPRYQITQIFDPNSQNFRESFSKFLEMKKFFKFEN
jgi:hypothetical protein